MMQGQYIQQGSTTPSVDLKFVVPSTGLSCTTLTNATAGLTLAYERGPAGAVTAITLASQTATGAWVSGGFVHKGQGVYRLDLPIAAAAAGETQVTILATALPADVELVSCVVALGSDNLAVAAPTDSSITTAVWAAGTRTLTSGAAPSTTDIAAAVRSNLTTELSRIDAPVSGALTAAGLTAPLNSLRQALSVGARFGGPASGGTSSVVSVYDAGNSAVLLGTVIVYRDASGAVVGQSALTPP